MKNLIAVLSLFLHGRYCDQGHGGTIEMENVESEGWCGSPTKFIVKLPIT
jgi:hypothetical protein